MEQTSTTVTVPATELQIGDIIVEVGNILDGEYRYTIKGIRRDGDAVYCTVEASSVYGTGTYPFVFVEGETFDVIR